MGDDVAVRGGRARWRRAINAVVMAAMASSRLPKSAVERIAEKLVAWRHREMHMLMRRKLLKLANSINYFKAHVPIISLWRLTACSKYKLNRIPKFINLAPHENA